MSEHKNQTPQRDESGRFLLGNQAAKKHGAWSLARSGKVPTIRGARALGQRLEELQAELEKNTPKLNVKKELLIGQIVKTEGMICMIEMYLKKQGILRPDQYRRGIITPQPALSSTYLSLINSQRQAIMALGLEPIQMEEILTPYQIVEKDNEHNSGNK